MGRGKRRKVSIGMRGHSLPEFKLVEGIFESLREQKVAKVEISFHAGGEEHHFESLTFEPELPETEAAELEERLDLVFVTVLNVGAGGWDDDYGSAGTMSFDVGSGVIDVDFNWYEQTSNESHESYSLAELEKLRKGAVKGQRSWLAEPLAQMPLLFTELEKRGITTVTATYNGGGDDGAIEEIGYDTAEGVDVAEDVDLLEGLDEVDPLAFTIVGLEHSGWENNNGGRGEVVFDVKAKEIRLEHADYDIGSRADPFALEGFMPFEIVKLKRGPRSRVSALAD